MDGFLLLLLLILINGLFAMSEIAVVASRKSRLAHLAEEGKSGAKSALELAQKPTRLLSTIQIGITLIGLLNGIIAQQSFADGFALRLKDLGVSEEIAGFISTSLVLMVVTFITIVLGELLPKRIGQIVPESIAVVIAKPMLLLEKITLPFVKLLAFSTDLLLTITSLKRFEKQREKITEEEIEEILESGSESGAIEKEEHSIVRNVLQLDDRTVDSLMTPRSEIVYLDTQDTLENNLKKINEFNHGVFPVVERSLDHIKGIITTRDILLQYTHRDVKNIFQNIHTAHFAPESLSGLDVLEMFKKLDIPMVFVVDEYGGTVGMLTLFDVTETMAGEFNTDKTEDAWMIQREDGSWLIDGMCSVNDMKSQLNINTLPDEGKARYNTVSGMVTHMLERFPITTDKVEWLDWSFEVVDMDGRRVDKLLATQILHEETPANADDESQL